MLLNVTVVSDEQYENAPSPIHSHMYGILTVFNDVHPVQAILLIEITESGISNSFISFIELKQYSSILFIFLGMNKNVT